MNKPQKIKIETPVGSIESDSGNHLVDMGTILIIVVVLILAREIIGKHLK